LDGGRLLQGNPLDLVQGDLIVRPVVKLRGSRGFMASDVLGFVDGAAVTDGAVNGRKREGAIMSGGLSYPPSNCGTCFDLEKAPAHTVETGDYAKRYRYAATQRETVSA
jgi:hypothetical protein